MVRFALLLFFAMTWASLGGPTATQAQPVRLSMPLSSGTVEIEVRDLRRDKGMVAARAALEEVFAVSQLLSPTADHPQGVRMLNAAAGLGVQPIDPRLHELLLRSLQFCLWSRGVYGPLGADLYAFWERRQGTPSEEEAPQGDTGPEAFSLALASSDCSHLQLSTQPPQTAILASGSRIDTWGMAQGFAVDRGIELLQESGVTNAWLRVGRAQRGLGGGPSGDGWPVTLPAIRGLVEPLGEVLLIDQALTIATKAAPSSGYRVPYIDLRSGRPAKGTVAILVLTENASEAEALATTLFSMDLREGQRRLGSLSPRPSVLWLLGEPGSAPLRVPYRWSEVRRIRR